jgi:Heat induced stress protein YflT
LYTYHPYCEKYRYIKSAYESLSIENESERRSFFASTEGRKHMVMSERSTVVGVFTEDARAEQAADELRRVGFSDDEISVASHGDTAGGFRESLKRLFSGKETTPGGTADDFMRLGVPEQEANYYQHELDAGRTVVLVRVADQQQEVTEILRHNGALASQRAAPGVQAETDPTPVAPDMYDPISNREPDDSIITIPEEPL